MKEFLKGKSKILFLTAILSTILFVLCIPSVLEYSQFISYTSTFIHGNRITELVYCVLGGQMMFQFVFIVLVLIMVASLFSIVGFIYSSREFNFMAIGLFLMVSCMGSYIFSACGTTLLLLLFLLNIFGYADQYILLKSTKKSKETK